MLPVRDCMRATPCMPMRFPYRGCALFQSTSHPFEITYGTGAVAGTVAFETLTLGTGSSTIVVPHQGFGMVYDSSIDFLTASCDGLFVRTSPLLLPHLHSQHLPGSC